MTFLLSFIKRYRAESICFTIFILLAVFGFCVHEPWYDEAQAWQIAKTASLHDILWVIPSYEGHPPFWHLLLTVPAKLGVPWQWAFLLVGMGFVLVNGFLLFFKAPFPRWVRCMLPFNYFLLYQYGIIVRPYSAILLIMLLLAIYFPQKNQRPFLFISLLAALCACHIFGIAIAGGITMAWLWEIKAQQSWEIYLKQLFKDKRFYGMLGLLAFVIFLFALLWPQDDGLLADYLNYTEHLFKHISFIIFGVPAEAVLTNLTDSVFIQQENLPWKNLLVTCLLGAGLWSLLWVCFTKKRILYLLLPVGLMSVVMIHYCSRHHIGLFLIIVIWYAWITLAENPIPPNLPRAIQQFAKVVLLLILIIPIGWTCYSLSMDYRYKIFPGDELVAFLKKHDLMKENIFATWVVKKEGRTVAIPNPNMQPISVLFNMYTPHNIIANFNDRQDRGYLINQALMSTNQSLEIFQKWRKKGMPMVLLGPAPVSLIYEDSAVNQFYKAAFITKTNLLWKFNPPVTDEFVIYLHTDLWKKLANPSVTDIVFGNSPQKVGT